MIIAFLYEWLFAAGLLILFAACGFGILTPFVGSSRYWFFAAPFAGLLVVPLGANALYSVFALPYRVASIVVMGCFLAATVANSIVYRQQLSSAATWRLCLPPVLIACIAIAAAVILFEATTLHAGGPALLGVWGTDHFGYAHLADWLNSRPVTDRPHRLPSAENFYGSWPAVMFGEDPRFGSFGYVAIVSSLYGTSGTFAYDAAAAVAISAAVLGLAAIFASSSVAFALAAAGLLCAHWLDYAHIGFFGKMMGYPAALFVAGLVLWTMRSASADRILAVALLSAAAATVHSGSAMTLMVAAILVPALLVQFALQGPRQSFEPACVVGLALVMPIIASGVLSRPVRLGFPQYRHEWSHALPRILDLDSQIGGIADLSASNMRVVLGFAFATWAALLAVAVKQKSVAAIGLSAGPALLLAVLFGLDLRVYANQLYGYFYPALVCGAACLIVGAGPWKHLSAALLVLAIAERAPRFYGAVQQFVLRPQQPFIFAKSEFDRLAELIGNSGVVAVDMRSPQRTIAVMVEFGGRKISVQWSQRAWRTILGYRPWPAPTYERRPTHLLMDSADGARHAQQGQIVHESARYRLIRLDN